MYVCHHCDNRLCCNPAHLFLGTPRQNTQDMLAKGRESRGSSHPGALLHERDVAAIRRCVRAGAPLHELARTLGVNYSTVRAAAFGQNWKHVDEPAPDRLPHKATVRGAEHRLAKLDASAVRDIRDRVGRGETRTALAAEFGVSVALVSKVAAGKVWRHVS